MAQMNNYKAYATNLRPAIYHKNVAAMQKATGQKVDWYRDRFTQTMLAVLGAILIVGAILLTQRQPVAATPGVYRQMQASEACTSALIDGTNSAINAVCQK
jgi:hypothetical protein